MPRLEIRDLAFNGGAPVNLTIEPAECVALSGPSGGGKTMMLRAVADLDPHGGDAFLDGSAASAMPAPIWRRRVGFLPADSPWWYDRVGDHFPTVDNSALQTLGFEEDVLKWTVRRLSSGEKQRLALLRLLVRKPEALLLDEPTANLDPDSGARVERLLAYYRDEYAAPVLWVSHSAEQAGRVARRRFAMKAGELREASF